MLWSDYDRYSAPGRFITDPAKLRLTKTGEVYLSPAEDYDIAADLEGREGEFESLRPRLVRLARELCGLDNMVQRFNRLVLKKGWRFPYDLAVVTLRGPEVVLEYWGREENTTFRVTFQEGEKGYALTGFGILPPERIPPDWDKEEEPPPKPTLLDWLRR